MSRRENLTRLLNRWASGDEQALQELMPRVVSELRRLARRHLARAGGASPTLQPTELVNEAYLRLVRVEVKGFDSRTRFFALASRVIRELLIDHARVRGARKRGGDATRVAIEDALEVGARVDLDTALAVHQALERLEVTHPRQGRVVELRLFGAMTLPEIARLLECSQPTVERDWALGRRRLARELQSSM